MVRCNKRVAVGQQKAHLCADITISENETSPRSDGGMLIVGGENLLFGFVEVLDKHFNYAVLLIGKK